MRPLIFYASITNYYSNSVGVKLDGYRNWYLSFDGNVSNTFTGTMQVVRGSYLALAKRNGATAIQNRLVASSSSEVNVAYSGQFGRNAVVRLEDSMLSFWHHSYYNITESFSQLVISGRSTLFFHQNTWSGSDYLFLDDLLIYEGSTLLIRDWDSSAHLLVGKDSVNLQYALNRIKFQGRSEPRAGLRYYNSNYWEIIPGYPEPSTYGATSIALSLGIVGLRRRRGALVSCKANL